MCILFCEKRGAKHRRLRVFRRLVVPAGVLGSNRWCQRGCSAGIPTFMSLHVDCSSSCALSFALRTTRRSSSLSLSEEPIRNRLAPFFWLELLLELLPESESEAPSAVGVGNNGLVGFECEQVDIHFGYCRVIGRAESATPEEVSVSVEVTSSSLSSSLELAAQNLEACAGGIQLVIVSGQVSGRRELKKQSVMTQALALWDPLRLSGRLVARHASPS